MSYTEQINTITGYFRQQEKQTDDVKLGVECEFFVVDKDTFESIGYFGDQGVGRILNLLINRGWNGVYEDDFLLGLEKKGSTITLEPGCQLELSIAHQKDISQLEVIYLAFIEEISPILKQFNQALVATGYQPKSLIQNIPLLQKKRYGIMFDYLKSKGQYAHHMMKGTASLQLSIDYCSEDDFIKKYRVASAITPILLAFLDHSPFFEGEENHHLCRRADIWDCCDNDRCGIVKSTFDVCFGYQKYAEFVLDCAPIFLKGEKEYKITHHIPFKDLYNPSTELLEHVLSMVFPDVRLKKFIEIRQMDALPYPLNFSLVALWKGLLYDEENLETLYEFCKNLTLQDIQNVKDSVKRLGTKSLYNGHSLVDLMHWLIELANKALRNEERAYLDPLIELIESGQTPKERYLSNKENLISLIVAPYGDQL